MLATAVVLAYFALALAVRMEWVASNWSESVGDSYAAPALRAPATEESPARTAPELWFGTDIFGQSVLRKTLHGAKISLTVALLASLLSIAIGVPMGAMAGYLGGRVDELVVWLYSTLSAIPGFLLLLAFAFVLRDRLPGLAAVYLAMGLTSWVGLCRLIRGEVIKHKGRDYVAAAQSYGASRGRIIARHIIPNVSHLILIDFSLRFVGFIHAEVILSFLGLGPNDQPSWGNMINEAKQELSRGVWWHLAAPVAAIFALSLALNIAGDRLRDALDPKLRGSDS
jgi:peptide/nickel transport system permease protein